MSFGHLQPGADKALFVTDGLRLTSYFPIYGMENVSRFLEVQYVDFALSARGLVNEQI